MKATLVVRRDADNDIKMRNLEVHLDGQWKADVAYGGSVEIEMDPGEHELKVTNKLKTERATILAREGDSIVYQAANVLSKGLSLVLSGLGMIVYHVTLKRIE